MALVLALRDARPGRGEIELMCKVSGGTGSSALTVNVGGVTELQ